ncbi:hypothetical protein SAMN05421788_10166 [Filimonas lacunae]|uniref:Uncharacterized protein n=1 Tax=Filimonas lacunae TaxID=477680 RepID=A0A1N7K9J5_9BACT|nr:hypothetical protein [Filimonas lacunae]SIS58241.1 hypothetical protein SAMN05421788_10166 [Filimonas lacunae]
MKTFNVRSAVARFSFTTLVVALLLVCAPFLSKANANNEKEVLLTEKQVSIQYAGYNDNSVVFRVKFENPTAQKFSLIIKNEAGDVLFQGKYSDTAFNKAVHILKEEAEMNPTFIIRVGNQKVEQTFSVSSNTDVVEDVVVTRI